MMIIAGGWRQVHIDIDGHKYVLFDQGIYKIPGKAKVERDGGADWVYCEAHADEETGESYAEIGGIRTALVYDPDAAGDSDD